MPIQGIGYEFHIIRDSTQDRGPGYKPRIRTIGRYQVYHDGNPQTAPRLSGVVAESRGPGANSPAKNGRRVKEGRYSVWTQDGGNYATWGYVTSSDPDKIRKPSLELKDTGARTEILIHPGHDFLASVGCINPCTSLPDAGEQIDFVPSRDRVIAIIDDLKAYLGHDFPKHKRPSYPPRLRCH
jgi:hypothetical protein